LDTPSYDKGTSLLSWYLFS